MNDEDKLKMYSGFVLFALSELMPFIRLIKSNGICDAIRCVICDSECIKNLGEYPNDGSIPDLESPHEDPYAATACLPPPA